MEFRYGPNRRFYYAERINQGNLRIIIVAFYASEVEMWGKCLNCGRALISVSRQCEQGRHQARGLPDPIFMSINAQLGVFRAISSLIPPKLSAAEANDGAEGSPEVPCPKGAG